MPPINEEQFVQSYVGDVEEMYTFLRTLLRDTATTAQLADPANAINTRRKYVGKPVFDTTLGQTVYATGATAAAVWAVGAIAAPLLVGAGAAGIIAGTGTIYRSSVSHEGDLIHTEIFIDLTGLNSSAAADIIGVDPAAADCHIGQITVAESGVLAYGSMKCLEAPATGIDDIDLFSATVSTGVEDTPITALDETALLAAGSAWTLGEEQPLTTLPVANGYLYLVGSGAGADATYTAGQFLIKLLGYTA